MKRYRISVRQFDVAVVEDNNGQSRDIAKCRDWPNAANDAHLVAEALNGHEAALSSSVSRDLAVEVVDTMNGHTMEFSSSPEAHRQEYDHVQEIAARYLQRTIQERDELRKAGQALRRACQDAGSRPVVPTTIAEAISVITTLAEKAT